MYGIHVFNSMCLWYQHCFTGSLRVMNSSSWRYASDMRKSNFPDFQRIFLYFPDFSQNLKFPWPSTKFPDLEFPWPVATMTFGSSNLPRLWYILSCLWDGTYKYVCPPWGIDLITTIAVLGVAAGCRILWLLGVAVLLYTMHLVVGHGTNHELSQTPFWLSLVQIYGFVALMTTWEHVLWNLIMFLRTIHI